MRVSRRLRVADRLLSRLEFRQSNAIAIPLFTQGVNHIFGCDVRRLGRVRFRSQHRTVFLGNRQDEVAVGGFRCVEFGKHLLGRVVGFGLHFGRFFETGVPQMCGVLRDDRIDHLAGIGGLRPRISNLNYGLHRTIVARHSFDLQSILHRFDEVLLVGKRRKLPEFAELNGFLNKHRTRDHGDVVARLRLTGQHPVLFPHGWRILLRDHHL